MPTRRQILGSMAALPLMGLAFPQVSWATRARGDARFAFVVLRGALDGLAAVPAYGDGDFVRHRGPASDRLTLDDTFGLNPALPHLHEMYGKHEALVLHAVATPYRQRSHFSGQDVLESGLSSEIGTRDGWLGRALPRNAAGVRAMALGEAVPLVLRGGPGVSSWAPMRENVLDDDTLHRIEALYGDDQLLSRSLAAALNTGQIAREGGLDENGPALSGPRERFLGLMTAAGRFLAAPDGPRIAVIDIGGWDTHNQQAGRLKRQLAILDDGLAALRDNLGAAWGQTAVLLATEFGRTAAINGTGGTDHGTGAAAFLAGGAVAGGRVIADWPGLADGQLFEARDLRPTTDLRAVAKGVLRDHLNLARADLDRTVFPDSAAVRPMDGLIRG